MKNVDFEILVNRMAQLLYDYDTYEAMDRCESEEDAYEQVEELLAKREGVETLIDFCDEILDSEDDTLYPEAEELKQLLSTYLAELM